MVLMMDDEVTSARIQMLKNNDTELDEETVGVTLDLIEATAVIRQLRSAVSKALELRGIWVALNDPLAFEGNKKVLRERFLQIEAEIRAAERTARLFEKHR